MNAWEEWPLFVERNFKCEVRGHGKRLPPPFTLEFGPDAFNRPHYPESLPLFHSRASDRRSLTLAPSIAQICFPLVPVWDWLTSTSRSVATELGQKLLLRGCGGLFVDTSHLASRYCGAQCGTCTSQSCRSGNRLGFFVPSGVWWYFLKDRRPFFLS